MPYGSTPTERAVMARALAFLYGSGATLVTITLLLPHSANTEDLGVAVGGVLAVFVVAVLLKLDEHASVGTLQAVLAAWSVLISEFVLYGGDNGAAYALMYVWVALYASFFLAERAAVAHLAFAAVLYAVVLAVQDDTPVEHAYWLMGMATVVVGAILIARLTVAIRAQAADLAAVAQNASGLSDAGDFARASCDGLHRSTRADAVVMLEPVDDGRGMRVTASAGSSEAGRAFNSAAARRAILAAFARGQPQRIAAGEPRRVMRRLDGRVLGLAQPILRDGAATGVLALVWTAPRRSLPGRVKNAALLFAAEASLAIDRAERRRRERERAALEINDNIVQGLVVAKYQASAGDVENALGSIDQTLARARQLMTDRLDEAGDPHGPILPGDLARTEASSVGEGRS